MQFVMSETHFLCLLSEAYVDTSSFLKDIKEITLITATCNCFIDYVVRCVQKYFD